MMGRTLLINWQISLILILSIDAHSTSIKTKGDIVLGGLFPVHNKGEKTPCGHDLYNRGLQRLEAMLFAVDKINSDPTILPNITLGVNILDTCSRDTYALNQSLEFIRASLNTLDTSGFECMDGSPPRHKFRSTGPLFGVVGGSYSSVSIQVANLLRLFRIPQISPASTANVLSDKKRFDFFARTVPADTYQAVAMVDLIKMLNWSYVSVIYSEGSYGELGIEVFNREAEKRNVCIAVAEKIPGTANERVFDAVLSNLKKKKNAKGVVLFTRADDVRGLLEASKRLKFDEPFYWVASDGWGKEHGVVEGLEDSAVGAITFELQSANIPGFDRYMFDLTPETNNRNPWFEDYWEGFFGCVLRRNANFLYDEEVHNVTYCDRNLRLSERFGYVQESKVQFVVDGVYAFAYALSDLHRDVCYGWKGICPAMEAFDGGEFYRTYILAQSFKDLAGIDVQFDNKGDGLARYDILNYQKLPKSTGYGYRVVGKWFHSLQIASESVVWHGGQTEIPTSVCSKPCSLGHVKIMQEGDTCCWICHKCADWDYVLDEFTCIDCGPGRLPYEDKSSCFDLELQYIRWDSIFAIVPMAISCLGIVLTLTVIYLFIRNNDTPIVKASGRELSYMLLGGMLLSYLNTFILIAKPSTLICTSQRFGVGIGFSIIYGALLTKTNRISRIFDAASKSARRPSFISPKSQMIITCSLIGVQVLVTTVWLLVEPPGTRYDYPDRFQVILKCRIQDASFVISQAYNVLLIIICTVYAVKTRKIPENFNESKFIGFTMYTTCIIWLAFVPIYFGTGNSYEIQIITLCVAISLSATVALACLYSPKIYIIVFHPDKNVRKLTMNSATYKKAPTSSTGTGTGVSANHGSSPGEIVKLQKILPSTPSKIASERESDSRGEQESVALL